MATNGWEWKPRGVGDWLDGIFQVYRGSFKTLYILAASFLVPVALIEGALNPTGSSNLFTRIAADLRSGSAPSNLSTGSGLGGIGILSFFINALLLVTGVYIVDRFLHGETVGIKVALNNVSAKGRQFWARWIGANAAMSLLILAGAGIIVGVAFAIGYTIGFKWLWIVGVIAAVPAAIFFGVRWGLAAQAIVVEGLGAMAGIWRSYRLTKGAFWYLFGRLFIFYLILGAMGGAVGMVGAVVAGVAVLVHSAALAVIMQGVTALVNAAVEPLSWIALTLLYYDLRIRKEGYDLQQKVESLEAGTAPQ